MGLLGGLWWLIPAITDFRAKGTIMGLAGLTAVFGMGTGVTPPVWSPEIRPAGGQAGRARLSVCWSDTRAGTLRLLLTSLLRESPLGSSPDRGTARPVRRGLWALGVRIGSGPIGVVKLLGC